MVADHWFMQIEKVLEAMEITFDTTKIRLAAFQLKGEAQVWLKWARTSRDRPRGDDMNRVPGAVHGKVLSGYCEACESSGVPRAEAGDDDRDGLCG